MIEYRKLAFLPSLRLDQDIFPRRSRARTASGSHSGESSRRTRYHVVSNLFDRFGGWHDMHYDRQQPPKLAEPTHWALAGSTFYSEHRTQLPQSTGNLIFESACNTPIPGIRSTRFPAMQNLLHRLHIHPDPDMVVDKLHCNPIGRTARCKRPTQPGNVLHSFLQYRLLG